MADRPRRGFIPAAERVAKPAAVPVNRIVLWIAVAGFVLSAFNFLQSVTSSRAGSRAKLLEEVYAARKMAFERQMTVGDVRMEILERLERKDISPAQRKRDEATEKYFAGMYEGEGLMAKHWQSQIESLTSWASWRFSESELEERRVAMLTSEKSDAEMQAIYERHLERERETTRKLGAAPSGAASAHPSTPEASAGSSP